MSWLTTMALKDAFDDVRATHSLGAREEQQFNSQLVELLLVQSEESQVGLPRPGAVVSVDDLVGTDALEKLSLVAVVADDRLDVLATEQNCAAL